VDLQGECREIDKKIENCVVYSYEKLTNKNWIVYDNLVSNEEIYDINHPGIIETTLPEGSPDTASSSSQSLNSTPSYGCIRCLN